MFGVETGLTVIRAPGLPQWEVCVGLNGVQFMKGLECQAKELAFP